MFKRKPKIGLVFGGGGARGFSHIGVVKALQEFGLEFDYIAGTSAGSIIGALVAAGKNWKEIYEEAKKIKTKDIRTSKIPLVPSKTDGIQNLVKNVLGDINIQDLPKPFSAVAVNIKAPKEVCISHGNLAKAIAGSCCVPGVFVPVEFDDMLLCDGGLQNTIPADIPRYFGCDYVVAVDCHKERTYGTDSQKLFDVLSCAIRILMKSNAVKGYVNADVVIAPETKRFKASRAEGLEEMMEEGYHATIDAMPEIMKLFKKRKPFRSKKYSDPSEIDFV